MYLGMVSKSEIRAIISLLDDPDEKVFLQIREKLISLGADIIPDLEAFWSRSNDADVYQRRIENIIHQIHFDAVYFDFKRWVENDEKDLLEGAITLARFQYPELDEIRIKKKIAQIEKDVWIELHDNLTAFEKVKILNHIVYDVHGFRGDKKNFHSENNSYINYVIEAHKGNPLSLSIIYLVVAQRLGIPIHGVNLPNHFVLCYLDENRLLSMMGEEDDDEPILFYINAFNRGTIFNKEEIQDFLTQLNLEPSREHFKPCTYSQIIQRMVYNLMFSYDKNGDHQRVKDLEELLKLFH